MSESQFSTTTIALIIVGLIIGAGAGYMLKPTAPGAGISEADYAELQQEVAALTTQVADLEAQVEALQEGETIKAAFIYVGPIGDYGWSHAHDQGRLAAIEQFPWLETTYAESVPEGDSTRYIDRYVQEGYDVVLTTSFGYMDDTVSAAEKYPDNIFWHCSGFVRDDNLGTYFAEFHQLYYLNGLMAGALTKTDKVGYVGAFPTPEVVRHIDAFALGVKEANPDAEVHVRWIYSWYDPTLATEAAEALIADGVDALAFTEDSPAVIQVGQSHTEEGDQIYTFAHYSPMLEFGPDTVVSGQLVDWGVIYKDIFSKMYSGVYTNENLENVDYWWMLKHGACALGGDFDTPVNPIFEDELKAYMITDPILGEISAYDLVDVRLEQMMEETVLFEPYTGPIYDNDGTLRFAEGQRGSHDDLWTINWYVDNVVGSVPVS